MQHNSLRILLSLCFLIGMSGNARGYEFVSITEILKDPVGREEAIPGGRSHEFIEFTNLGTAPLSLDSLLLCDGVSVDSVVQLPESLAIHSDCRYNASVLPPGKTAVILSPDYPRAPVSSAMDIAPGSVLLTVNHARILGGLARDDGLILYKGTADFIARGLAALSDSATDFRLDTDRLRHSSPADLIEGTSLIPSGVMMKEPWVPCPERQTPGKFEALHRSGWLAEFKPHRVFDSSLVCSVAILHAAPLPKASAWWIETAPLSSGSRVVLKDEVHPLEAPAIFEIRLPLDSVAYRLCLAEAEQECWDIDLSSIWLPPDAVGISELFPRATDHVPEWFELTNRSPVPVDISGWSFGTHEASETLSTVPAAIPPRDFLVVTRDASKFCAFYPAIKEAVVQPPRWRTLRNTSDTLCLWDRYGNLVEKAAFSSSWFPEWTEESLERVDFTIDASLPGAWSISRSPTPGMPGTAIDWRHVSRPDLRIGPTPFTPDGDGTDDQLLVEIKLPPGYRAELTVVGFDGKVLWEFPRVSEASYMWRGVDMDGRSAPPGPFYIVADITNGESSYRIRNQGILWR